MLKWLSVSLLLLSGFCAPAQARVDEISYAKNGVYAGKIGTYTLNGTSYLDASQSSRLMGGKIYWYPVSGKLMLQIKGGKVLFYLKSDTVMVNDESEEFPNPMIVRGGKAFLSLDFFVSKLFSGAFGFSQAYDRSTRTLSAQRAVNVTSVNYYTYPDKTRIVLYLDQPLEYQVSQKENNLFKLSVMNGVISAEEKINVGDGVVRGFDLQQENKLVRVVVNPDEDFGKASVFKLTDPDRIVIDVTKEASAVPQAIGRSAEPRTTQSSAAQPVEAAPAAAVNIPDKLEVGGKGRKKIVIDAGHGGKDPGGRKLFGLKEKDLNLLEAKELYEKLKAEDMFDVMLTRSTDEFIPLADRSEIANNAKADLFISIHANATRDRRENGFEIYFMSERASDPGAAAVADYENSVVGLEDQQGDPAAMLLHSMARNEYLNEGSQVAGLVAGEMEKRTPFANRGVKQAAFYVLRGTYAPGILIEMGFMTNSRDQKNMNDKKVRAKIADAVYRAVMKYASMKGWK